MNRLKYLVVYVLSVSGVMTAVLGFVAATLQYRGAGVPAFVFFEVLFPYGVMLTFTLLMWHRMGQRANIMLSLGILVVVLGGILLYAKSAVLGPPDPNTAAHMALFIYPVLILAGFVFISMLAILVRGKMPERSFSDKKKPGK